jgi:hypothetical protein
MAEASKDILCGLDDGGECHSTGRGGVGGSSQGEDNDEDGDKDINDNWTEYVSFIFLNCYAFAIYI